MTWGGAKVCCRRRHQQTYSDAAIQACLTLKVLFGLPLRQTTEFVESLLKLVGGLVGPRLQHPVPPSKNIVIYHSLQGFGRAIAPADRQHRDQGRG